MTQDVGTASLEQHGLSPQGTVYWDKDADTLLAMAVERGEGELTDAQALVVLTGSHTGRAPNDKFLVEDGDSSGQVWWGDVNRAISPEQFDRLHSDVLAHLNARDLFVKHAAAGADEAHRVSLRVITENAWHALFAHNLFIDDLEADGEPDYSILHAPSFQATPERHGTNSGTFIVLNLDRRLILIGGTSYAGEIKKSIFTVMNYRLPLAGVLSMHCSANQGTDRDVALFFGLSGTGKTTLSSDPDRALIGDDEHGWDERGVFNIEGGCYAKTIRLSQAHEPVIWRATRVTGTVLENVVVHNGRPDFEDDRHTENTRAGYTLEAVELRVPGGQGGHPENVFFLTADAFGVLPPVSRLSRDQAMYYFLSGYTSKLAGTEKGLGSEPQATFSACFGEPFLPLHPTRYAELLGERIESHDSEVWLINTGWTGGPHGVGSRIHLPYTRAMVAAALNGELATQETRTDPTFGLVVPTHCSGVPDEVLDPRQTWDDSNAYDEQAGYLALQFVQNFEKYLEYVPDRVAQAGPIA